MHVESQLRLKEYAKTVEDASTALEYNPKFIKALYRRAKAYQALGDVPAAIVDMHAFLAVDPTNKPGLALMTELKSA
jgi:tetratricopeptide (TPR) repeat protein